MNSMPAEKQEPDYQTIEIDSIIKDPKAQPRVKLSKSVIERYASDIKDGADFPPVVVFFDGEQGWLADGFHRVAAHIVAGQKLIDAELHPGGLRDAILYAASANATHGFQRTDEDKRRAVEHLLADPEWSKWSDRAIATRAGVSHTMVGKMRQEEAGDAPAKKPEARKVKRGKSEYTMKPKPKAAKVKKAEKVEPKEGDRYRRGDIWHTFKKGEWVADPKGDETSGSSARMEAPWADHDALRLFTTELGKQAPAAVVGMLVGVMVHTRAIVPSPESAAQLLTTRGIDVSPQNLVQVARWFEGIAFALDAKR